MQTQDIKRRIKSVTSTQQITRAMKFVAAAKLRRAQERMQAMRPYAEVVEVLIKNVVEEMVGDEHPIFQPHPRVTRAAYVVIAGDRGLCGGFNANLLKAVVAYAEARHGVEPVFFAVGKQAIAHLRKTRHRVVRAYYDVFEKLSYILTGDICELLVSMISSEGGDRIDEAYVVYNEFASMLTQRPVIRRLAPINLSMVAAPRKKGEALIQKEETVLEEIVLDEAPDDIFDRDAIEDELLAEQGEHEARTEKPPPRPAYEFYPESRETLDKLISRYMATEIFRGMMESYAAELAARMTAMDNATANADEMISTLTLDLNRARQTGITMELLDIVGGANALG